MNPYPLDPKPSGFKCPWCLGDGKGDHAFDCAKRLHAEDPRMAALHPHVFEGRLDRSCEVTGCGKPDRAPVHIWGDRLGLMENAPVYPADLRDPEYHTPPSKEIHYHDDDPHTAFPGKSCEGCLPAFADAFMAKTAAQSDRFMVPAAADYLACDRTLNEERARLLSEYFRWSDGAVLQKLQAHGLDAAWVNRRIGEDIDRPGGSKRRMRELLVDVVCPRAWLDRRLREVL